MDNPASQQPRRGRNLKRARASESGNTAPAANPVQDQQQQQQQQVYGAGAPTFVPLPAHAHRANADDTVVQPPTFPSQQLDARPHHHLAEADALMNGYNAPPSQYPEPPADVTSLGAINNGLDPVAAAHHAHDLHAHHQQQQTPAANKQSRANSNQQQQTPQPQHHHQQRPSAASANKTSDRNIFGGFGANNAGSATDPSAPGAAASNNVTPAPSGATFSLPSQSPWAQSTTMPQGSPGPGLQPPPEGIYRSFEDLLSSVQKNAKEQGYGVVKLRASNYREGKATRYDLVCDRGGVKYNSTAKKRNPSTRKVDCPWRAKAVCEVQLGNQWRFVVQDQRHNHEPRVATAPPGQENTPIAQAVRSMTNKLDRIQHDMIQGFQRMETVLAQRFESLEDRVKALEHGNRGPTMLASNGQGNMGTPSMPTANMGGAGLTNGPMSNGGMSNNGMNNGGMGNNVMGNGMGGNGMGNNGMGNNGMGNGGIVNGGMGGGGMGNGGMVESRLQHMEARVSAMEQRNPLTVDSMTIMDDESRLLMVGS